MRDVQDTADLSVTEKHFRGTLWSYLGIGQDEGHIYKQPCGCDTVARLDDMVQRGLVARARAAALCNVLAISDFWSHGMLWRLVQEHRYAVGCRCVQKVLAWGVCPHVSTYAAASTAIFGFLGSNVPKAVERELLSYGACPWYAWYARKTASARTQVAFGDGAILQDADAESLPLAELRLHWRRWHARLCKRRWVMLAMANVR